MKAKSLKVYAVLAILTMGFPSLAWAYSSEVSIRLGPLYENFSGPVSGSTLVPTSIDVDYALFINHTEALTFRYTLAATLPSATPYYLFAGAGMRFYLDSKNTAYSAEDNGLTVEFRPVWRYFWGFDAGISQVIVKSYGTLISANSTNIAGTLDFGVNRQLNERWSVNGLFGVGPGFGFTAVAVTELTARLLFGVSYLF